MRKLWATTLLACGVAAVGITGAAPAHAAATCNGLTVTISGTDGNDVRVGTPGPDVFAMGAGNDVVSGLDGNDTACMGTGDDHFFGGRGDDTFVAESVADGSDVFFGDDGAQSGHDTASYAARTTAVTVSLDGSANDGQAGEGDFIAGDDVDAVRGGSGDDVLTENAPGRTLFGGPGNDRLNGASDMFGEAGADTLIHLGGGESAFLHGGDGADRLIDQATVKSSLQGDAGPDRISGGAGATRCSGEPATTGSSGDPGTSSSPATTATT